jgi:hypothetical protein
VDIFRDLGVKGKVVAMGPIVSPFIAHRELIHLVTNGRPEISDITTPLLDALCQGQDKDIIKLDVTSATSPVDPVIIVYDRESFEL